MWSRSRASSAAFRWRAVIDAEAVAGGELAKSDMSEADTDVAQALAGAEDSTVWRTAGCATRWIGSESTTVSDLVGAAS